MADERSMTTRTTHLDDGLYAALAVRGMSRRTFLKLTSAMAGVLALPHAYGPTIAAAVEQAPRIPVIWLRGQSCGGETAAFLRASEPTAAELLLEALSIDYQETLMGSAGAVAEGARLDAMTRSAGGYFAVVEGAVPAGEGGAFSIIGGRAFVDVAREVCDGALATIAVGGCAADGGIPAAAGGTTGAGGIGRVVTGSRVVNLPGCPVNVDNLTATIVHYMTFGELPPTDGRGRPLFAYGELLHNQCERRAYYEFGQFVHSWGDEGAQKGWCLYKMGCKGPEAFANCPTVRFGEETSWPVRAGHGCVGCTMPGFLDSMGPIYRRLPSPLPFAPGVSADQIGVGLVGAVAGGAAVHGAASYVRARRLRAAEQRAALVEPGRPEDESGGLAVAPEARTAEPASTEPAQFPAEPAQSPAEPANAEPPQPAADDQRATSGPGDAP
jgi:hydrogenase small subunit